MKTSTIELLKPSEYARRRGCSEGAVRRAARSGRITLIDGKIDPVAADAQWLANTRVRAGSKPAGKAPGRPEAHSGPDGESLPTYDESRARREAAEAHLAELRLAEQCGELVRSAVALGEYTKLLIATRETFLQMPSRVVPILAACTDAAQIDAALSAEIQTALRSLAGAERAPSAAVGRGAP